MINAIAAIGQKNRVLGNNGQIPWYIPEDFSHFKEKTIGHPIIMGRKTFETFKKPLPGRTHIVITRDINYKVPEEVLLASDIESAIRIAEQQTGAEEIFIIGGGQIYESSLDYIDRIFLTIVEGDFEGDAFFPEYENNFKIIDSKQNENSTNKFSFNTLERI